MPNVGPIEGWRMAMTDFLPMCFIAWPSPTVVVVLPSPSGVGVIAETTTYLAFGRSDSSSIAASLIFARLSPYGSIRCLPMPISRAMSSSGDSGAAWAISRADGKPTVRSLSGRVCAGVVEERDAAAHADLPVDRVGDLVEREHVEGGDVEAIEIGRHRHQQIERVVSTRTGEVADHRPILAQVAEGVADAELDAHCQQLRCIDLARDAEVDRKMQTVGTAIADPARDDVAVEAHLRRDEPVDAAVDEQLLLLHQRGEQRVVGDADVAVRITTEADPLEAG